MRVEKPSFSADTITPYNAKTGIDQQKDEFAQSGPRHGGGVDPIMRPVMHRLNGKEYDGPQKAKSREALNE